LVLSGGGARGLAHIGVLRALHEQGIEVHAIAGTSMGAIIGGLYASGHSAEQIEEISREMDWQYAFSDRSPRSHSLYEYRQLDAFSPVEYRLRLSRKGVELPRGVLQGQHLSQVLDELFAPALKVHDFDQLDIPFRAVASDLVTGEVVVLGHGNLSAAIRASMSIPALLEPVLMDERLLVDGGISDNIPVGALADKKLDRLIVVDVGTPRIERDNIKSVGKVVSQLSALLVRNNSDRQLESLDIQDVVITPDLVNLKNSDFDKVDEAILAGYEAAMASLREASPPLSQGPPIENGVEASGDVTDNVTDNVVTNQGLETRPIIDFIEVQNDGPVSDRVVRSMLQQEVGKPLDTLGVREDISHIYALDYFNQIRYELIRRGDKTGLLVVCTERDTSNTYVQFGLALADDFRGNATFGLSGTLRSAGLNRYGGTALVFANLGTSPVLEARFFQPLDHRLKFFVEPLVGYRADTVSLFFANDTSEKPITEFFRSEYFGGLDLGAGIFRQRGEMRIGWRHADGEFSYAKGFPFADESFHDGYVFSRLGWDTYDDLAFPREGIRGFAEHQFHRRRFAAEADYDQTDFSLGIARTVFRTSVVAEVAASITGEEAGLEALVPLGGFLSLSGLPPDSLWGSQRAIGRLVVTQPLRASSVLPESLSFYVGGSVERGNVWFDANDISGADAITAGSIFLGTKTPLGPGYLSLGFVEGGARSVNLNFGHVFR
jgi:NTE family protein